MGHSDVGRGAAEAAATKAMVHRSLAGYSEKVYDMIAFSDAVIGS